MIITRSVTENVGTGPNHISGRPGKQVVFIWPWNYLGATITDVAVHYAEALPRDLFASFKSISIMVRNQCDAPCRFFVRGSQFVIFTNDELWTIDDIVLAPYPGGYPNHSARIIVDLMHQPLQSIQFGIQAMLLPVAHTTFLVSLLGEL